MVSGSADQMQQLLSCLLAAAAGPPSSVLTSIATSKPAMDGFHTTAVLVGAGHCALGNQFGFTSQEQRSHSSPEVIISYILSRLSMFIMGLSA